MVEESWPLEPTETAEVSSRLRRRRLPTRVVGDTVIVARPRDGAPVTMTSAAALVWRLLDDWMTPSSIDARLAEAFPRVAAEERATTGNAILKTLLIDDLLERR